ncbi:MAG: CYTH domain-containing protein [Bacteroides sp.]|nr:CYTH domain-containing protein [Bacteroides sp.]
MEIEHKFLVKGNYKDQAYSHARITQGYLNDDPERTVRIRMYGEKAYITIKGASNAAGTARFEWEKEIPVSEANQLISLCLPGVIDKTRYLVKNGDHTFEIDEFYGDNQGLVLAEVELKEENELFEKPDFIGREVTGDPRYYNSQLRKHPYKQWNTE